MKISKKVVIATIKNWNIERAERFARQHGKTVIISESR